MPGEDGKLTQEDLDKLNAFLNDHSPDEALTCPVTGERVPIKDWNAPESVLTLSGGGPTYGAVPLTSPAGGVILLSVFKIGL